jgi:hypothetical protein
LNGIRRAAYGKVFTRVNGNFGGKILSVALDAPRKRVIYFLVSTNSNTAFNPTRLWDEGSLT